MPTLGMASREITIPTIILDTAKPLITLNGVYHKAVRICERWAKLVQEVSGLVEDGQKGLFGNDGVEDWLNRNTMHGIPSTYQTVL
jgi:hypothetical protein